MLNTLAIKDAKFSKVRARRVNGNQVPQIRFALTIKHILSSQQFFNSEKI
jgi:hypothetical protein